MGKHRCQCCGNKTLPVPAEQAIAYICPVCYWENDVFIKADNEPSDENRGLTLKEAQHNFREFGACEKGMMPYVRNPQDIEKKDKDGSNYG